MPRKFIVGGNWKMNGSTASIKQLVESFNSEEYDSDKVEVVIGCPSIYIPVTREVLRKDWFVSAQNCYLKDAGAFTGEISPSMIKEFATHTILGHSERRHVFGEDEKTIADKAGFALEKGLHVIFCIGETLEQREANQTLDVCIKQLSPFLARADVDWSKVVLAYEPVWAIGTGVVATPSQAQAAHDEIRKHIAQQKGAAVAEGLRIMYGGSVTPSNCVELAQQPDIDGFLVGGASLKPDFIKIVKATH